MREAGREPAGVEILVMSEEGMESWIEEVPPPVWTGSNLAEMLSEARRLTGEDPVAFIIDHHDADRLTISLPRRGISVGIGEAIVLP